MTALFQTTVILQKPGARVNYFKNTGIRSSARGFKFEEGKLSRRRPLISKKET